jgi:hypothetical protein
MDESPIAAYEHAVAPARERFAAGRGTARMLAAEADPRPFHLLMIYFCALGAQMTGPVEGWIRRAGERCDAIGLPELGKALRGHAKAEAGHDLMMVRDTHALVDRWNARYEPRLDAAALLAHPSTPGVEAYRHVHESTIEGPSPFAQIAVEYEIEQLPLRYGPPLIRRCADALGADIIPCLSFLTEHVELDIGHTKFNHAQLCRFLDAHPGDALTLAAAGSAALDAYHRFLEDCVDGAQTHVLASVS